MRAGEWERLGLVGTIAGCAPWAVTHSALPAVWPRDPGLWTLYASTRDADGRSSIGRTVLRMDPEARLAGPVERVLAPGALGCFDDRGVTMSCIVSHRDVQFLYYTGWVLGVTVPFYLSVGLAVSDDGGRTFRRASPAPILDRSATDPFLTASPFVLCEEGRWRMWYVSGTGWEPASPAPRHRYHIKYAESDEGIVWRRHERPCIDYASPDEYAFGRPFVRREGGLYRMWYSHRGSAYRIGYAESEDGIGWRRLDDQRGLAPAGAGWDGEMVEYPWLFDAPQGLCMLYNGNDYGAAGIGLAVWHEAADARGHAARVHP